MQNAVRRTLQAVTAIVLVFILSNPLMLSAQEAAPLPAAGAVPGQIPAGHTIFFTNDGAAPNFPLDPNDAFNRVHDALAQWGRYQLVDSPQQADLLFQLRSIAPITQVVGDRNGVSSIATPAFTLTILDARTNTKLWTVDSPFLVAPKRSTRAYWEQVSVSNLVSRLKVLAGQPLSAAETADLTTYPRYHGLRTALIFGGVGVAAITVATVVALHEMHNNAASFCAAHNLSPCPGA